MADCICGNPEGENTECERCNLIMDVRMLESENRGLLGIITDVAECAIEHTSVGKYHTVQIGLELWDEICGLKKEEETDNVSAHPSPFQKPFTNPASGMGIPKDNH